MDTTQPTDPDNTHNPEIPEPPDPAWLVVITATALVVMHRVGLPQPVLLAFLGIAAQVIGVLFR